MGRFVEESNALIRAGGLLLGNLTETINVIPGGRNTFWSQSRPNSKFCLSEAAWPCMAVPLEESRRSDHSFPAIAVGT